MKPKELAFNEEARQKMLKGVETLAQAVATTLGPKGRNVTIEKVRGLPVVTKDGVTVAKEVVLKDRFENVGAQLVREVAERTADEAGDGTTTAVVLALNIFREGMRHIIAGCNPMSLKRGMDKAVKAIVSEIKEMSRDVKDNDILNVATISANSDNEIGQLIADAINKVGKDGCVTVENAKGIETTLDLIDGTQFKEGWQSPYMVTNPVKMITEFDDPLIFLYDARLNNLKDIVPLFEKLSDQSRPVLVVSEFAEPEVLNTLAYNNIRGILKCCAVKMYGFGENGKANLEDLAILTGATVISRDKGMKLKDATIDMLGSARKVKVTKKDCTIMEGHGQKESLKPEIDKLKKQFEEMPEPMEELPNIKNAQTQEEAMTMKITIEQQYILRSNRTNAENQIKKLESITSIDDRITQIKEAIEAEEDEIELLYLKARLARMVGGIAVINVGASTEVEAEEKKMRIDDAICATKAAIEEGIVVGGGCALLRASNRPINPLSEQDEATGRDIILKACEAPIRQICANAGEEGTVVIKELLKNTITDNVGGFNAATGEYVDMYEAGIIDPTKVVRLTLQNAASIAGLLLTTECIICEEEQEDEDK